MYRIRVPLLHRLSPSPFSPYPPSGIAPSGSLFVATCDLSVKPHPICYSLFRCFLLPFQLRGIRVTPRSLMLPAFQPAHPVLSAQHFYFITIPPPSAEISSLSHKGRNFPVRSSIYHRHYTPVHVPAHCPMLRRLSKEFGYAATLIRRS